MVPEKALVVVHMVTYNHEGHIARAVESVMMQQASFSYKVFIGEDHSTDRTREICLELKAKYPERIELFLNQDNLGGSLNSIKLLRACLEYGSKYIAMLEGDDFWTDPYKLQKQIDKLVQDENCIASFHNVAIIDNNEKILGVVYPEAICDLVFEDLLKGKFIKTPSIVFRNILRKDLADFIVDDTTFGLYLLRNGGYASYIDETMAAYRTHEGGIWSKKNSYERYLLSKKSIDSIQNQYRKQYPLLVNKFLYDNYYANISSLFRGKFYRQGFVLVSRIFNYRLIRFARARHIYNMTKSFFVSFIK